MLTSGSSTGGLLEIGISLVMQDRFSHPAREASTELRRLYQEGKMAVEANLQAAKSMGTSLITSARDNFRSLGNMINSGSDYIDTMTTVKAITQATAEQYNLLGNRAKQLGLDTVFSAKNIAGGMKYLAMAGMKVDEIQRTIGGATYLAGATGIQIEGKGGAADLMTNIAKMYNIDGIHGSMAVADVLTKGTLSANVSVSDLAESIKYAGSTLVTFDRTLEESVALIGALGNAGIQGSMAGVALQNMFQFLSKAITDTNSRGAKALASLGINPDEFVNVKGELIDTWTILDRIKGSMQNMSQVDQVGILRDLFSMRGQRGAVALLNNLDSAKALQMDLLKNKGYAKSINDERMDSLWGRLEQFREGIETFHIAFSESVTPILKQVYSTGTKILTWATGALDKWYGKALAYGALALPIIKMVVGQVMNGFAIIRLAQNDSLVSGKTMFQSLFMGWASTNNQALQHVQLLRQIQMLQAGIGTGMAGISSMNKRKQAAIMGGMIGQTYYHGNYIGRMNKKGRMTFYERQGKGKPPKSLGYLRGNPQLANQLTQKMLFPAAAGAATGAVAKGVMGRLGGLILGLGRFLTGPWGLALTAISLLLPSLLGAIKNRTSQAKDNAEAVEKNTHSIYTLAGKMSEDQRRAEHKNLSLDEEMITLVNVLQYWNKRIEESTKAEASDSTPRDIVINIDGKEAIRQAIKDNQEETNLNLGIA